MMIQSSAMIGLRLAAVVAVGVASAFHGHAAEAVDTADAVAGRAPKWTAAEVDALRAEKLRVPAYMTETWAPPENALVWARPGESGVLHDPANWRRNGKSIAGTAPGFDHHTDLYLPPSKRPYKVSYSDKSKARIEVRHVTVGDGASFVPAGIEAHGNIWIHPRARLRARHQFALVGDKSTFFLNDKRLLPSWGYRSYEEEVSLKKSGYEVSRFFHVKKEQSASVEFIGHVQTSDDFQMDEGTTIVGPNSQLWPGSRSIQQVSRDAALVLHSGSSFGKCHNSLQFGSDLAVVGRLQAGSPQHPLTAHAHLGISFKNRSLYHHGDGKPQQENAGPGLVLADGAEVLVYTRDPKKAALVIGWHGREHLWMATERKDEYGKHKKKIDVVVLGRPALENVVFDHVAGEGFFLEHPDVTESWTGVSFGAECESAPGHTYVQLPETLLLPRGLGNSR